MRFADLLRKTRDAADSGRTWEEAWQSVREDFRRLAARMEPQARLRAYESVLASYCSDGIHPVEPPGTLGFSVPKTESRIDNPAENAFGDAECAVSCAKTGRRMTQPEQ